MTLVSNVQWHGLKYSHECITFSGVARRVVLTGKSTSDCMTP